MADPAFQIGRQAGYSWPWQLDASRSATIAALASELDKPFAQVRNWLMNNGVRVMQRGGANTAWMYNTEDFRAMKERLSSP